MTIRHIVAWKLITEDSAEKAAHAQRIVDGLNALQGVVPSIITISAGSEALFPGTNHDVAVVADFADAEALAAYKVHPAHEKIGGFIGEVTTARVAVDFEV